MGVLLQGFYWGCPAIEKEEYNWWNHLAAKMPSIAGAGFTAIWLPPANKAASGNSMGYDTYDYYDLGEFNQKGSAKTWFGSKQDLLNLIGIAHANKMQVYADLVFHQNSGADAEEVNPLDHVTRWTKFTPMSGKFSRTYLHFQPSIYETIDGLDPISFGGMPNLCHRNPEVYTELLEYGRWLLEELDYDGFRYDCVRGYGAWMVRAIQELRTVRNNAVFRPFGVAECWDNNEIIDEWLKEANSWVDNPCSVFDFPLRFKLQRLCDSDEFSLTEFTNKDTILLQDANHAVTFVENHDLATSNPIINDKMLAYSFILTHEGYPCVFWQDYFTWNLAQEDNEQGIAALLRIHEQYAGGETEVLHVDDRLYIMQRSGHGVSPGLVYVLNNLSGWNGMEVRTKWVNQRLLPVAWNGKNDRTQPAYKTTDQNGIADFWAAGRGYCVYIPDS